ncbi:MAG: hypothetical protein GY696_38610 [Gammaproteobacteria bacterium]|nr:hypothetical protein [Gammaproteobacteria bacterium]
MTTATSTANTPPVLSKSHSFCSPTTITPNSRILEHQHSNNIMLMTNSVHQNNSNRSPLLMHHNSSAANQHHYPGSNGILKKDPVRTGSVQDILESGGGNGAGNGISQADLQRARYN